MPVFRLAPWEPGRVTMDPGGVFVFAKDGDLLCFPSSDAAAGSLEAVDVVDGEYPTAFTLDGYLIAIETKGETVHLEKTSTRDEAALREALRVYVEATGLESQPDDPRAVANELLRWEWEGRWPKRPRWLSRRLHGTGPPQL